ncbi:MAG TPA: ABC transporter permease [Acidisoma sp.]|uniref:ABC transporter permease n=1 Tax=Acidisoma sp. TaxID=1872115 RepID=UPI002BBAEC5D|nr:ABC transporter permease [Acidisoma sp.]HTI00099.1 ABC transporter permease [Acidisoma sp.]
MTGSLRRIWGLMYRHLCLYRRSWPRLVELAYWPILQMCIWGFTASFISGRAFGTAAGGGHHALILAASTLLAGVLLWEICIRSQMGVAISFMEELWSRNLGHIFISPLRPWELIAGLVGVAFTRTLAGVLPAILVAWALYAFNLFALGPVLVLFFANLMIMGWAVALGIVALILRYGAGAEALAWSLLFGLTPLAAVYYPVSTLPAWLQPISRAIPATHVFEGMRAVLLEGHLALGAMAASFGLNIVWLAAASLIFAWQFQSARRRGALVAIGE